MPLQKRRTHNPSEKYVTDDTTAGREGSPGIEYAFQDEICRVIIELLQTKGLYQNMKLDPTCFNGFKEKGLVEEFRRRPFTPRVREETGAGYLKEGRGMPPMGTPHNELPASFWVPSVNLDCTECGPTTFVPLASVPTRFSGPYPVLSDDSEQIFTFYFRCAECRASLVTFQIFRRGLKLQLTGRSIPFRPRLEAEWPNEIREVVQDSRSAAGENDIPGAYYHLRTAIEFIMKGSLGIPRDQKIEGTTLCEKYNEQTDDLLKARFPMLAPLYAELSAGMHSRATSVDRLQAIEEAFLGHLKARDLFKQYGKKER